VEKIEHIVNQYFKTASNVDKQLEILSVEGMAVAVGYVVNKSHLDAINTVIK